MSELAWRPTYTVDDFDVGSVEAMVGLFDDSGRLPTWGQPEDWDFLFTFTPEEWEQHLYDANEAVTFFLFGGE